VSFPAQWHDASFNGVLPKGTPVAQCLPIKRESWSERFDLLSNEGTQQMIKTRTALSRETGIYRREFRAPKR
jgi:hypothetical protein